MNENMRKVYEEEIDPRITSVEEINEDEYQFIQFLKEEGIPYKKEICKKEIEENFYFLEEPSDTILVISVPEEHVRKILEGLPDEFHDVEFRVRDLSEEEQKELNRICADDYDALVDDKKSVLESLMEINEAKEEIKKMTMKWNLYRVVWLMCFAIIAVIVMFMYLIDGEELLKIFRNEAIALPIILTIAFTFVGLLIFFSHKMMQSIKFIKNNQKKLDEELIPSAITSMTKPLVYQSNGAQYLNAREMEIIKNMYNREDFEIGGKISINKDGECFTITELVTEMYMVNSSVEPYKIKRNLIKTKSPKHIEEPLLIKVFWDDESPEEKLVFETYKNSYEVSDEILSAEFKNRAKELEEKYENWVCLYYIADVVYILIDSDFSFPTEKFFNQEEIDIQKEVEEHYTGILEVIRNYIELAEML